MTQAVLVPVDGSPQALVALPVARTLAEIWGAAIHVVQVADRAVAPGEIGERLGLDVSQLRGAVLHLERGQPAEEIARVAGEQPETTIVMCTHTGPAAPALGIGPVAEMLLARLRGQAVLVRPEQGMGRWRLGTVLIPHDGTPATSACLRPAAELASRASANLVVVHVAAAGRAAPAEPGSLAVPRYVDQRQHEWPSWAAEFLDRLGCISPFDPSRLRLFLAHGEPGAEVLRIAGDSDADLIVLAWRGALDSRHARVVRDVLAAAPCPVMILRVPAGG